MKLLTNSIAIAIITVMLQCACSTRATERAVSEVEFTIDTLIYPQAPVLTITYEKEDFSEGFVVIESSSNEPMKWRFLWPDSLYDRAIRMSLNHQSFSDTVKFPIAFKLPEAENKLILNNFLLSPGFSKISLRYDSQNITPRGWTGGNAYISRTSYETKYILDDTDDIEFRAALEATWDFGQFLMCKYEEGLERYDRMSAKHPDSHYLMANLSSGVSAEKFRSKDDIRKVFDNFSSENRSGYWGTKIEHYLSLEGKVRFENIELPAWDTRELEPIITDTSKYSLVVFSASWCNACHAMIPLLKEMYSDIGDKINIVYVSVDDVDYSSKGIMKNGFEMWGDVMRGEEIPWRSVMALGMWNEMRNTYFFSGIPAEFLIAPDMTMEKIDIGDETVRRNLYDMVEATVKIN